jgi:hypothetical protein
MSLIWGIVVIACGVFVCVYGNKLFRLTLGAMGFGLGFIGTWWLAGSQPMGIQIGVSLVAGAIGAVVLYSLIRVGVYIAGGLLGLVVGLLIVSIFNLDNTTFIGLILLVGVGGIGFLGNRLASLIIPLATGAAGAFMVAYGLVLMFAGELTADTSPLHILGSPLALTIFVIIVAISALGQLPARGTTVVRVKPR